jgi:hypothetical protein
MLPSQLRRLELEVVGHTQAVASEI